MFFSRFFAGGHGFLKGLVLVLGMLIIVLTTVLVVTAVRRLSSEAGVTDKTAETFVLQQGVLQQGERIGALHVGDGVVALVVEDAQGQHIALWLLDAHTGAVKGKVMLRP
ncbi:MAG: hypothetical protein GDA50_07195 [Alphaproteobacteria bacterium GM202ARS2]|nr:hypothetical protein [Alphaproteobacteria bacterium GM202ARS2]